MRFETQTNLYGDQPLLQKLTTHDTQFNVVQGEINALISESEMEELVSGGGTMYSAMNDINIDVQGLHADLLEMNTTIEGQSGQITQLNSKQAEYEASLESLSATLSDTNATLYGDGETAGITTRMTNIEATASGISSSVSSLSSNLQNNYYNKGAVDNIASGISSSASSALTSAVNGLQNQIDGKIETWCKDGVPTASNYPASNWTTTILKDQHIGDLYYDTKNGYAYQFTKQNNVYSWNVVTTSGIGDALTLAGNKRRVFVTQPTPPYEIGDLWVQGSNGDIMRCGTARASGNYTESDWVKASKYTDDTALNAFKNGQYAQDITAIGAQLDNKVEIHYGTVVPTLNNAPANSWSTSERAEHLDDLYYNTSTGYCYRFIISGTTYSWVRIKDSDITSAASVASTAQSIANGKATIFTGSTTPALPRVGDLWLKSANDDILTYVNDTDKWQKYNKYTDDTTANQVASNLANNYSTTTQIQQNSNGIITTAISNVDGANFISQINQTAKSVSIDAKKINLNGYTTINGNFSIDNSGKLTILSGRQGSNAQVSISGDNIRTQRSDGSTGVMFSGPFLSIYGYDYDGRVGLISPVKIISTETTKAFGIFAVHDYILPNIDADEESAIEYESCGGLMLGVADVYRTAQYEEKSYNVTSFMRINYQDNGCIGIYKPINTTTQFINGANLDRISIYPSGEGGSSIVFQSRTLNTDTYTTKSYLTSTNTPLGRFILKDGSLTLQSRSSASGSFSTVIVADAENNSAYHYASTGVSRTVNVGNYFETQIREGGTWTRKARVSTDSISFDFVSSDTNTYRVIIGANSTNAIQLYKVNSNGTTTLVKKVPWQSA